LCENINYMNTMRKLAFLFLAAILLAANCKKPDNPEDTPQDEPQQEEVYECLPIQLDYSVPDNPADDEQIRYSYDGNAIDYKTRYFSDGSSYRYNYYYVDQEKGLLDRIEIIISGSLVAKFVYTIDNELIAQRELLIKNENGEWESAFLVKYFYDDNGKVSSKQILDYDYWDADDDGVREPTDQTVVLTYTGDNVTNEKWYNTNDMETLLEEYIYEYDENKRPFANVVTMTYPETRVNNITKITHYVYGTNPTSEIFTNELTYNNKSFLTLEKMYDKKNNLVSIFEVTYENCE